MRVTNSMLVSSFMNNLNTNTRRISALQDQLASGKTYNHISDDPVALIYSQQARFKLARLEDYKDNVDVANKWLTQAEGGALELNSILTSVYETCIDAATDVKNGTDLTNMATYVDQMLQQIVQDLNTAFGDKYVFGGYNTTGYNAADGEKIPPFTVETVNGERRLFYNGYDIMDPANQAILDTMRQDNITFDVALGSEMPVTVNGLDVVFFGPNAEDNIFHVVNSLYNSISSGGPAEEINKHITNLQTAQNHVLMLSADIGGRVRRLEILQSRYEQDTLNYTQMLSDAEDADYAEVMMNYSMAQSVYKASLQAGALIIQPTLMDFLN